MFSDIDRLSENDNLEYFRGASLTLGNDFIISNWKKLRYI